MLHDEIGIDAEGPVGHSSCDSQKGTADRATRVPRKRKRGDHPSCDVHSSNVAPHTDPAQPEDGTDQGCIEAHKESVGAVTFSEISSTAEGRVDHSSGDNHPTSVDPTTIAEIRAQWRRRQAWHRAEKALTLQAKALCRALAEGGDKAEADTIYRAALGEGSHPMSAIALAAIFPLTGARDSIAESRNDVEKRLRKLAKTLPVAPWVEAIPGASLNALAAIVGEAGDIGQAPYTNPAKLWKRMGLAIMPDGTRQQKRDGDGYAPARRSVVWNIGGALIGGMGRGPRLMPGEDPAAVEGLSGYQAIFVRRLRHEAERDPSHARPITKAGKESFSKHAANRAKRYVEKRFLRDLWSAWRRHDQHSPERASEARS